MRLLHWNILHGGGSRRMPEIGLSLVGWNADIVLLSEYRITIGGQLRGILADCGLIHQLSSEPAKGKNGLLLASRQAIRRIEGPALAHGLGNRWLDIEMLDTGLCLTGVHIPDDSRPTARASCWLEMVRLARIRAGISHIFFGDFNTGRHYEDEPGATFTCTRHLGTVCSLGYVDAFRRLHPTARDATWKPSTGMHIKPVKTGSSEGFRLDSALLSPPVARRLTGARYAHCVREMGISDHSAMIIELDNPAVSDEKCADSKQKTAIF